jgi:hypothetical protein
MKTRRDERRVGDSYSLLVRFSVGRLSRAVADVVFAQVGGVTGPPVCPPDWDDPIDRECLVVGR